VPVGINHNLNNILNVSVRDLGLKKIAHAVNENGTRTGPIEWLGKLFGNQPKIKALLVRVPRNAAKSLSKHFGVAVFATRTDLRTSSQGVPRRIGPFDL
jgi:hypothetical protein